MRMAMLAASWAAIGTGAMAQSAAELRAQYNETMEMVSQAVA
jgi:hypothetical protein